jgi:hypothetical protein
MRKTSSTAQPRQGRGLMATSMRTTALGSTESAARPIRAEEEEEESACHGEGSVVGPLLAARALPLRCAASTNANVYTGYA